MFKKLLILILVLAIVPVVYAGTTGKIAGIVKDKQTGEPLPGVNVLIEGTTLGASTDIDGYFVIVNVPVGVHELKVTYIGYKEILIYNVRVVADATTRYDFEMEQTLLEVSEVIEVVAERELIAMDNTASRTVITSEVIASQPVDNITRTVSLTAGNTEGSFRGGRRGLGEVKYLVDGVDVSSPMAQVNRGYRPGQGDADMATDLPESALQEVSVITGGMSAQYEAKSAVVNVVTKSGGPNFSGFARIKMTPSEYGQGSILPYDFGQVSGYRTLEEEIREAKIMGQPDANTNDELYAPPSKAFGNRHFRRYEFGFGGPIPLTGLGVGGNMSFNIAADIFDREGFQRGVSFTSETWTGKLVYNTASNTQFTLSFLASESESREYAHTMSRIVTTGDTVYNYNAGGDKPTKLIIGSIVHPDGTLEAVQDYDMLNNVNRPSYSSNMLSFKYKNTVSSKTFYELGISRFNTEGKHRAYDPATGKALGLDDFRETRFTTPNNSAYFPEGAPISSRAESYWYILPMYNSTSRQDDRQTIWTFKGDLVSQLNEYNELRVGMEYKSYEIFTDYAGLASGGNEYTNFIDNLTPRKFAAYVEDKIETDGMIINAGLRFDWFDPNAIMPENFEDPLVDDAKDPASANFLNYRSSAESRIKNPTDAEVRMRLSPRIGISFPITELDVFHINYGHYFGIANFANLFDNYTWSLLGAFRYLGNPNLEHEKIISYEAGLEHGFTDDVKLSVTGFFKDIDDLINKQKYVDEATGAPYWVNVNADYANIKGFEVSLQTRRWYNSILQIAYTYQIAKGKNSSNQQAFSDFWNTLRPRTDEYYLDWDVRHTVAANFDYRIPEDYFGNPWIDDWGANFIITYNSGRPYSSSTRVPPPDHPPINDRRYPSWLNVDMRVFKNFSIWKSIKLGAFFEVYNLFNDRTIRTIQNVEMYDLGTDEGDGTQNVPSAWAWPTEMRLGFELLF